MKMTKTPFGNPTVLLTILVIYIVPAFSTVQSQEAQWIWHPNWKLNQIPKVTTYYRKTFRVDEPEQAEILIAADDKYELFVNSKKMALSYWQRAMYVACVKFFRSSGAIAISRPLRPALI